METIHVSTPIIQSKSYPIMMVSDVFDFSIWLSAKKDQQLVIITDHEIKKRYGVRLQKALISAGYQTLLLSFSSGEDSKNYKTKQAIEQKLQKNYCDKNTFIIALGGGVVGDLAGFIAATYLRGISYLHIPTTLLAMVDSSIGGKTAINTSYGKNMIGSIYQPLGVVIDIQFLKSLPQTMMVNGLIEAIKMFITHDVQSFYYVQNNLDQIISGNDIQIKEIIQRAIQIKAEIVSKDVLDFAERSVLNFGHTIGHALEKTAKYSLLHGYAVAYGILVESMIAHLLGLLNIEDLLNIKNVLNKLNIHGCDLKQYHLQQLIHNTTNDKKNRFSKVHYVLLQGIGRVYVNHTQYVHPVESNIVQKALQKTIEG